MKVNYDKSYWDDDDEAYEFVVTQERTILVQYTIEASSMTNAIQQIESGDYSSVIDEDSSYGETEKLGRIVSVKVNDDD